MQNAFTGVLDKKRDVELGVEDYVKVNPTSFILNPQAQTLNPLEDYVQVRFPQ